MRLLMIYADRFAYRLGKQALEEVAHFKEKDEIEKAVVGFIHVEEKDKENRGKVVTKLIKHLKWLCGKNETKKIVLHSFSHLSLSKASPSLVLSILEEAEERLIGSGYEVYQTPIGYFLDLDLSAPGHPLARVFKEF